MGTDERMKGGLDWEMNVNLPRFTSDFYHWLSPIWNNEQLLWSSQY